MTGEELYAVYQRKMDDRGVQVDSWGELEETDRSAWNATLAEVFGHSPDEDMGG